MILVGTSGWNYPHWRERFYPPGLPTKDWLAYYARRLRCVEINNSFYRLPEVESVRRWSAATPTDFIFSVKVWQAITHRKKLKDGKPLIEKFLASIEALGTKLGPVLFQLPPRWHCNLDRLAAFLDVLPERHRYVFELRDPSWHNESVYELLRQHNCAFCIYQLGGFTTPIIITADFAYVRLHGPDGPYQGSYDIEALKGWARNLMKQSDSGFDCYLFFDNDQNGFALDNALMVRAMLEGETHSGRDNPASGIR